ncbi:MAG TPA: sialidase family protein [Acidobacteriota bacterium]|nr:sialidase family protein [Acidobacteriota bacterium]
MRRGLSFVTKWKWKAVVVAGLLALLPVVISVPDGREQAQLPESSAEGRAPRMEWLHSTYKDPATGIIPSGIRARELRYVQSLPKEPALAIAPSDVPHFDWAEAGPSDIGGRTRALAVSVDNPRLVLAGSVSGGLWRSQDGGAHWSLVTAPGQHLGTTALAQDPRPGFTHIWYAAGGEWFGDTTADRSRRSPYFGQGLLKSSDRGQTWTPLESTMVGNPTLHDAAFDFIIRVAVSPQTGSVFLASNAFGVLRSDDGGQSFALVLGSPGGHSWADVAAGRDGTMLAVLSQARPGGMAQPESPGVYTSNDDGLSWTSVTPATFPALHGRSVVALAPSDPDLAYVLTYVSQNRGDGREDVRLHRLRLSTGQSVDRTANLPNLNNGIPSLGPSVFTQQGWDMVIAVKPNNPDFLIVGGTTLYRSRDAFATPASTSIGETFIGGYVDPVNGFIKDNHWVDQHIAFFSPHDANELWTGNDGGVYVTRDATAATVVWEDLNQGYAVTQFYAAFISQQAGDKRIFGGTQDNGTLLLQDRRDDGMGFAVEGPFPFSRGRVALGDGTNGFVGEQFLFLARNAGEVRRLRYLNEEQTQLQFQGVEIRPSGASGAPFFYRIAVDPSDENVLYYPAGSQLWRNNRINDPNPAPSWTHLPSLSATPASRVISDLEVSHSSPSHALYIGASGFSLPPQILRIDQANVAVSGGHDISIPGAPAAAWVSDIAVNPFDGQEILVTLSNYNIIGLYHSTDGGATYSAVEGNLAGDADLPGPSLRSAAILPLKDGSTAYFVGTSAGLFSTSRLRGMDTVWTQRAFRQMGTAVVVYLTGRPSDETLVAATHGRGLFVGKAVGPASETTLYLPFLQGSEGAFTGIALGNLSDRRANLRVRAFSADGAELAAPDNPADFTLEPEAQLARLGTELFSLPPQASFDGWAVIRSDVAELASFFQFGSTALTRLDGSIAQGNPLSRLIFTRVFQGEDSLRGRDASTFLRLVNPNEETVRLHLRLTYVESPTQAGTPSVGEAEIEIAPLSVRQATIPEIFDGLSRVSGGYVVADVLEGSGVVGFQFIRLEEPDALIGLAAASPNPSSRGYSAQLASQPGLFTNINLVNVSADPRQVTMTAILEDGTAAGDPVTLDLGPASRYSADASDLFPLQPPEDDPSAPAQLIASLLIDADGPDVLGDVLFGDADHLSFAAALPLQSQTWTEAAFSQVANVPGFFTGLAFFNPGDDPASLEIQVFSADGGLAGQATVDLPAGSRLARTVPELVPGTAGQAGGYIRLKSDAPLVAQQLFGAVGSEGIRVLSAVPPTVISLP